jgi:hypothetical protein
VQRNFFSHRHFQDWWRRAVLKRAVLLFHCCYNKERKVS